MISHAGRRLKWASITVRESREAGYSLLALVGAVVAFWKIKIIDSDQTTQLVFNTIDLYTEHYPMAWYGFRQLASGSVPLWNPYQLCGVPFLAIPHTGLFYPGNLPYILFDTAVAIEVVYVAHTIFAGWSFWLLTRAFGMRSIAGLAGAVTFIWSGWMISNLNQPAIHSQMCLLPATILMIELTMRRQRWAYLGTIAVFTCQIFAGATEVMVYNLYAAAMYTILRTSALIASDGMYHAAVRAFQILCCFVASLMLAAPQLLPSIELVMEGVRHGGLSLQEQRPFGPRPVTVWARSLLTAVGAPLPFLLLGLGARVKSQRTIWIFGFLVVLVSGLLSGGGSLYEAYRATPFGEMFRHPVKFLHLYYFGLALIAAAGLNSLLSMTELRGREFWTDRFWLLNVALGLGLMSFLVQSEFPSTRVFSVLALIIAFAAIPRRVPRIGIGLVILTLQVHSLFIAHNITHERPLEQPGRFDQHRQIFDFLRDKGATDRVYLSPRLRLSPGLTLKQGMMNGVLTTGDYEPLSTQRHAEFFDAAAGPSLNSKLVINASPQFDIKRTKFAGYHLLNSDSELSLMRMASTRHFVTARGDEPDSLLHKLSAAPAESGITRVRNGPIRIYEDRDHLPRAFVVSGIEVVAGGREALEAIVRSDFDPRMTVILETGSNMPIKASRGRAPLEVARIVEYEPERVVIEVDANRGGILVLTDFYYTGWQARVEGERVEILRANYLFRAVAVKSGKSIVTFEYRPLSFRAGIYLSAIAGAAVFALTIYVRRRSLAQLA